MSTYSFADVNASIVGPGGAFSLGAGAGVAEGGITITGNADRSAMTIGADGQGMHVLSPNRSGTVVLRYLKTAPINALLQALYNAQTLDSRLHGKNVITVTNSANGDVTTALSCAFKGAPELSYDSEGAALEWTFDSLQIETVLGTY